LKKAGVVRPKEKEEEEEEEEQEEGLEAQEPTEYQPIRGADGYGNQALTPGTTPTDATMTLQEGGRGAPLEFVPGARPKKKPKKSDGDNQQQKRMIVVEQVRQMQMLRQAMQRYQDKRDPPDRYKPHPKWAPKVEPTLQGSPKGSIAQMLQRRQAEAAANL
jgi:hypothetical protein